MSTKKFFAFLSIVAVLGMLLVACQPATVQPTAEQPTAEQPADEQKLICVIVPPVENPFFGTQQDIAAKKTEELGYKALKLVHGNDANK